MRARRQHAATPWHRDAGTAERHRRARGLRFAGRSICRMTDEAWVQPIGSPSSVSRCAPDHLDFRPPVQHRIADAFDGTPCRHLQPVAPGRHDLLIKRAAATHRERQSSIGCGTPRQRANREVRPRGRLLQETTDRPRREHAEMSRNFQREPVAGEPAPPKAREVGRLQIENPARLQQLQGRPQEGRRIGCMLDRMQTGHGVKRSR